MLIECTPGNLIDQSKCILGCSDEGQKQAMMVWLLAQVAKVNSDPGYLLDQSRCLLCLNEAQLKAIMAYLLCQISNAECYPCQPFTPCPPCPPCPDLPDLSVDFTGALNNPVWDGSTTDWLNYVDSIVFNNLISFLDTYTFQSLTPGVATDVEFLSLTSGGTFVFFSCGNVVLLNFPVLLSLTALTIDTLSQLVNFNIPLLNTVTGDITIQNGVAFATFSAPSLLTINNLTISNCLTITNVNLPVLNTINNLVIGAQLASLSLPSLANCASIDVNTNLIVTTSLPNLIPTNGGTFNFSNNAMDQASVDQVLARCVANAAYVTGTVDLSGGTNSTPSAAGLLDKATLIGRGVAVFTN